MDLLDWWDCWCLLGHSTPKTEAQLERRMWWWSRGMKQERQQWEKKHNKSFVRLPSLKQEHTHGWCSLLMLRTTLPPGGCAEKLTLLSLPTCVWSGKREEKIWVCGRKNLIHSLLNSKIWWCSYKNATLKVTHTCQQIVDGTSPHPHIDR